VEFKQCLIGLCDDLSGLVFQNPADHVIVVEGTNEIPSSLASPLGLIATELITNSVKHANGNVIVRIEKTELDTYSLSVLDVGMKLILRFLKQIGGDL
jgi:two-component sensor histidine kinase